MPIHKKNHTTPEKTRQPHSSGSSVPPLPAPEDFHQYLRAQPIHHWEEICTLRGRYGILERKIV